MVVNVFLSTLLVLLSVLQLSIHSSAQSTELVLYIYIYIRYWTLNIPYYSKANLDHFAE